MTFSSVNTYIFTLVIILLCFVLLTICLFNLNKKYLLFINLLIIGLLILFSVILVKGEITSYSNGIKIDENGKSIQEYSIYKDESYVTTERVIGSITINNYDKNEDKLNKRIKITRNLFSGTKIYLPENDAIKLQKSLSENERTK